MPWPIPESREERLALAKGYPFSNSTESFLFSSERVQPIASADFAGRRPVLAHGSNRAPDQLLRKYGHLPGRDSEIPVTFGWLCDYDVVYAAHITRYGAVSSTLQHATGCATRIAVTWLTETQLDRMHETESGDNYDYGSLKRIELSLDAGPQERLSEAELYLGRHGCLAIDNKLVGLAAVISRARPHQQLHQEAVQTHLRNRHRPGHDLDELILRHIGDQDARRQLAREIQAEALMTTAPHFLKST